MSALAALRRRMPRILAEVRRLEGNLRCLTPDLIAQAKIEAEQDVKISGLPGKLIKARFDKGGTSGRKWAPKADGSPATLVETGLMRREAAANANDSFSLDLRYKLHAEDILDEELGGYARHVNDGTSRMPARPFYANWDAQESKALAKASAEALLKAIIRRTRMA